MNESVVRLSIESGIARITLHRPEAMNALSAEVLRELIASFDRIESGGEARVVVLSGSGTAFCAGGDLKGLRNALDKGQRGPFFDLLRLGQVAMQRLEKLPVPTIAAVNGVAVAGGLELILCCDLVVAAESARIGDGHAKFGLIPGGGGAVRLPRKLPVALAKELLYSGDLMPATELARWGLVNRVVPDDQLDQAVNELAGRMARNSPLGLGLIKRLVDDGLEQPQATALRAEIAAFEGYIGSHDLSEGLSAFVERRKPRFSGS